MNRPSKPEKLTPEQQRRRFIQAAKELGVDKSEGVLEDAVRKLALATKTTSFRATTEAEARALLDLWKQDHPTARIIVEHPPSVGIERGPGRRGQPKGQRVSILIEYVE